MASLDDILSIQQAATAQLTLLQQTQEKLIPSDTSGAMTASRLVQVGFVRVQGISVLAGSPPGKLHDVARLADVAAGNEVLVIPTSPGYYAMNILFKTGLAFVPGTSGAVVVFYSRT